MTSERRTDIDLEPLLAGLEQPSQLISDPQLREHLKAYVNAARPQVERAAFDLLSQVVDAFNDGNPEQRARLEYAQGSLHLRLEPPAVEATPETTFNEGDLEKVTLRLPKELKELIDNAAGRYGMSANNWYVRELSRTIRRHLRDSIHMGEREEGREGRRGFYRGRGHSLHGFVGGDQD